MNLRNKKTGKLYEWCSVMVKKNRKSVKLLVAEKEDDDREIYYYESFEKMCEEWGTVEDPRPKEPLIENDRVRKAVEAWAEVNDLCGATYSERPNGCAFIFEHADGDKTVICFRSTWLGLEKGKAYGIAELCGEEEE